MKQRVDNPLPSSTSAVSDPEKTAGVETGDSDDLDLIRCYLANGIPYQDVIQESITLV